MADPTPDRDPAHDWKPLLMADLREQAVRRSWGPALMAVGFVHLGFFVVCHVVYLAGVRAAWVSLSASSSQNQ